jgi:DNA-binding FadR family transcriptional regulator
VKTTTAQSVARQILDMIRRGVWKAGDQLPTEKELIEKLAVGRSTVREALQILATLNVVRPTPGQGTFIQAPTVAGVLRADLIGFLIDNSFALELIEAREMIEPPCARLAALRGTAADFARIEALLTEHEAAHRDGRPVSEHAAMFHLLLAEASHNRVAASFMASIIEILKQRGRRFDAIPDYQQREIDEHRAIFAAASARDGDRAAELMLRHIVDWAATYDTGKDRIEQRSSKGAGRPPGRPRQPGRR